MLKLHTKIRIKLSQIRISITVIFLSFGCLGTSKTGFAADSCRFLNSHPQRYAAAIQAEQRHNVPIELMLAIMWRESKFRATARPYRRIFGFVIGPPRSSAYGYAQVIDSTWQWYQEANNRPEAIRDNFADAIDFIGWYVQVSNERLNLSTQDPIAHYLAYHQGHRGYQEGRWTKKPALIRAATDVAELYSVFRTQLQQCAILLAEQSGMPPPPARLRPIPLPPRLKSTLFLQNTP